MPDKSLLPKSFDVVLHQERLTTVLQLTNHIPFKINSRYGHRCLDEITVLSLCIDGLLQFVSKLIPISDLIHHQYIMCQSIADSKHEAVVVNVESPTSKTVIIQRVFEIN